MQGYSLLGYVNAVRLRSGKTLLVEGASDKKLLGRLKLSQHGDQEDVKIGFIDGAEILEDKTDQDIAGKGNREKIQVILRRMAHDAPVRNALTGKFGTLIDREWDGLIIGNEIATPWVAPVQSPPHFVTTGHSIENYFFTERSFKAFLCHSHPESLTAEYLRAIEGRFAPMVAMAFAWSMVTRDLGLIKRAAGLIKARHLKWEGGRYSLSDEIDQLAAVRNISSAVGLAALINSKSNEYLEKIGAKHPGIWLCHGHLGEEVLWACVANLGGEFGIGAPVVDRIEMADKEVRLRYFCDNLAREAREESQPLSDAIQWLYG